MEGQWNANDRELAEIKSMGEGDVDTPVLIININKYSLKNSINFDLMEVDANIDEFDMNLSAPHIRPTRPIESKINENKIDIS